jgi:hypothetical protein
MFVVMRRGLSLTAPLLFTLLIRPSFGQTTAPSSPAMTQPAGAADTAAAVALDQSTPRGVLKLFFLANARGDGNAIRALIVTENPAEEKMAAAMADKKNADRELTAALNARFPDPGKPDPGNADAAPDAAPDEQTQLAPVFAKIDASQQILDGDTATLSAATDTSGDTAPPFTLKRVAGKWMIPLAALIQNVDADILLQQSHQIEIQVEVMRSAARDVTGGKYATKAAAIEDAKKRMFDAAVADHVAAATRP